MIAWRGRLHGAGRALLLVLIVGTFVLDFFHGIRLGEDQIAYSPIYRFRQSLAVAISRLHDPPAARYLAYKSVVDALSEGGLAIFDTDPGQHLDAAGQEAMLNDGPRLDRAITQAREVTVDPGLQPQIIQANELGLADYMYWSFRLFGSSIASLYYFFFLIAGVSGLIYVWQFRDSPFLLFTVVIFFAALWLLENYSHDWGLELNTIHNSRLFSGLSLLPALHVLFVLWRRRLPNAYTITAVLVQSVIFAFLLSCRTEVGWQLMMVAAAGCALALWPVWRSRPNGGHGLTRLTALWSAAAFLLITVAYTGAISLRADPRYAREPEAHVFWHEALRGIFMATPRLRLEYVGDNPDPNRDNQIYDAVIRDLNRRNDASSAIVQRLPNGRLTINPMLGWSDYDRLVRSLTLRIILHHPLAVLGGLPIKLGIEARNFMPGVGRGVTWRSLRIPLILVAFGALACVMAGGLVVNAASLRRGAGLGAIVLASALLTPMLTPSNLAIGTAFVYFGALTIMIAAAAVLLVAGLLGYQAGCLAVPLDGEAAP